ncbi:MAG: UDP-N-acetylenolpyruvoylglucosamine reductase, partial [Pseudomonadota bacterium]
MTGMTALASALPPLRGRLTLERPLAPLSWLRVGGPAALFFQPADRADLAVFLAALPEDVPLTPL